MGAQMVYMPKPVTEKESEDGGGLPSEGKLLYGVTGMQGWRRNMEDSHIAECELDEGLSLFGVFDGHGGRGVSRYVAKRLPDVIKETQAYKEGNYAQALETAFLAMDEKLRTDNARREVADLDKPDPGKEPEPLAVPKKVLQRIMLRKQMQAEAAQAEAKSEAGGEVKSEAAGGEQQKAAESVSTASPPPSEAVAAEQSSTRTSESPEATVATEESVSTKASKADTTAKQGSSPDGSDDSLPEVDADDVELVLGEEGDEEEDEDLMELDGIMDEEDEEEEWDSQEMVLVDPSRFTRDPTPEAQGCTAVVVLLVRRQDGEGPRIVCANAGDSRGILSRNGTVVALSEDHKPENDSETARIQKAGGYVEHMQGGARVQGDLNLSRALGDLRYKIPENLPPAEQILTAFPEVKTYPLKVDEDEFIVLGCDGIWETNTNQSMVDFVRPRLAEAWKGTAGKAPALSKICEAICDNGLCPSMEDSDTFDGSGCDNMTVVVVQLKAVDESSSEPCTKRARTDL